MKIFGALPIALIMAGAISSAQALPIKYDFSASNFTELNGHPTPAPYASLSGSFTLDSGALTDFDLTMGSNTYSILNTGYIDFGNGFGNIGDIRSGSNSVRVGTDDFWLAFSPGFKFRMFAYSVSGPLDLFTTVTGSITDTTSQVPEPSSLALLAAGILGLGFSRRFARK